MMTTIYAGGDTLYSCLGGVVMMAFGIVEP